MSELIYDDAWTQVVVPVEQSAVAGQVTVVSKLEATTLAELSDEQVEHLFFVASYASTAVFELLGVQGTNMLLTENDGPLSIEILARRQDDGINMMWQPTQPSQNELASTAKSIRDVLDIAAWHEEQKKNQPEIIQTKKESEEFISNAPEDTSAPAPVNYLLKHLRRTP